MNSTMIRIMADHLSRVWSERDSEKRMKALNDLYKEDCILIAIFENEK